MLQERIGSEADAPLAFVTEGAVALDASESPDPALAAVWGLVRSAQSEHPGRFLLIDTDGSEESASARLRPAVARRSRSWRCAAGSRGRRAWSRSIEADELETAGEAVAWSRRGQRHDRVAGGCPRPRRCVPSAPGEVRIAVHAAGLNFRDVLIALGIYPGMAQIGGEGAGVVLEVGPEVEGLKPGDRVLGLIPDAFAPVAISHASVLRPLPEDWSFEQARRRLGRSPPPPTTA